MRDVPASRTLGGGRFLDLRAPERKRRAPERMALLDAMAEIQTRRRRWRVLLAASAAPVDLGAFARDHGAPLQAVQQAGVTPPAPRNGRSAPRALPSRGSAAQRPPARLRDALAEFHAAQPDLPGMGLERLRMTTAPRMPAPLYRALRRIAEQEGWLALEGAWVRLASHRIEISAQEEALWAEIRPMLADTARFRPPRVRDIARDLGREENEIRRLMRRFRQAATIDEVAQDHFFLRAAVAEMVRFLAALEAGAQGWVTAAAFRDVLETEGRRGGPQGGNPGAGFPRPPRRDH